MVIRTTPDNGFPYPPIEDQGIRLFRVHKNEDGSIEGEMQAFALQGKERQRFMAISYHCGPQDRRMEITLNGRPMRILRSVRPILEMICGNYNFKRSQWWWLDSVCIDESNKKEHSAQVNIMDRIYRASERTLIWLGERTEDSDEAIEFLDLLRTQRRIVQDDVVKREAYHAKQFKPMWLAVQNLFLRPWWKRVWTLQECIVPKHAVFYCGQASIDRDRFQSAVLAIYHCRRVGNLMCKEAWDAAWNRRRFVQWYQDQKSLPLVALLAYMGELESGDDRDRIYSLLGLVSPEEREVVGSADYEHDVEVVYSKLVERHVRLHNSLDIICLTHLFNKSALTDGQTSTLPSWAPDWRAPVQAMVVPLLVSQSARDHIGNCRPLRFQDSDVAYQASGSSVPNVNPLQGVLECEGIFLDMIDGLGGVISREHKHAVESAARQGSNENEDQYIPSTSLHNRGSNENDPIERIDRIKPFELLERISRALTLDREDKYLCNRARPQARSDLRTLCQAVSTSSKDFSVDLRFLQWYEGSKMLQIRGMSLDDIFSTTGNTASSATPHSWIVSENPSTFQTRFLHPTLYMQRRLMVTNQGHVGMAPSRARKGDVVAVLKGCNVPVLLRRVDGAAEDGDGIHYERSEPSQILESKCLYELIGECYIDGFMEGEILEDVDTKGKRRSTQWFRIA